MECPSQGREVDRAQALKVRGLASSCLFPTKPLFLQWLHGPRKACLTKWMWYGGLVLSQSHGVMRG